MPAGILVKMLKKEKKRAQDAAAQLANITSGHGLASQSASRLSAKLLLGESSTDTISANYGGQAMQYMKRGTLRSFFCMSLQSNFYEHFELKKI